MNGYFENLADLIAEFDLDVFDDETPPANWDEMFEFLDDQGHDYTVMVAVEESHQDLLNEQGPVAIGHLQFDPHRILEELDPIAYRCGLIDYAYGLSENTLVLYF